MNYQKCYEMKIVILGRGNSCLRCERKFVESHDLVVVVNKFVYDGYEQYVGDKADVQFRNYTSGLFTSKEINQLELRRVIFTHWRKWPKIPSYYKELGVDVLFPDPPTRTDLSFNASSGIVALYYMMKNYPVTELSLVGFDLFEKGFPPYYFKVEEVEENQQKYFRKGIYRGNKISVSNHHDADQTALFIKQMVRDNGDVKFNVITNSSRFNDWVEPNVNFL